MRSHRSHLSGMRHIALSAGPGLCRSRTVHSLPGPRGSWPRRSCQSGRIGSCCGSRRWGAPGRDAHAGSAQGTSPSAWSPLTCEGPHLWTCTVQHELSLPACQGHKGRNLKLKPHAHPSCFSSCDGSMPHRRRAFSAALNHKGWQLMEQRQRDRRQCSRAHGRILIDGLAVRQEVLGGHIVGVRGAPGVHAGAPVIHHVLRSLPHVLSTCSHALRSACAPPRSTIHLLQQRMDAFDQMLYKQRQGEQEASKGNAGRLESRDIGHAFGLGAKVRQPNGGGVAPHIILRWQALEVRLKLSGPLLRLLA